MKAGSRGNLLRNILAVLCVSLLLCVAWSIGMTWYGANEGGFSWMAGSSQSCHALLEKWRRASFDRASFLSLKLESGQEIQRSLEHKQIALLISNGKKIHQWSGKSASITEEERIELSRTTTGYFVIDQRLFHVSVIPINDSGSKKNFILIDILDQDPFLKAFSLVSNAEVVIASTREAIEATLKDSSGKPMVPQFQEPFLARLRALTPGSYHREKIRVGVSDYVGFTMPGLPVVNRGASQLTAFSAFFPIANGNTVVAYLGILVPVDALLYGAYLGIYGSLLLLAVVTVLASWIIVRTANPFMNGIDSVFNRAEQMQAERDEARAESFMASKMASLGEMASSIAHEINSPLAIVRTTAGQIIELVDEEPVDRRMLKEMASSIEETSVRIATIVKGLRTLTRNENKDPLVQTEMKKIIEDTLAFCADKFRLGGVKIILDPVPPEAHAPCHPGQISQVLLNLLNNAFDAIETSAERWIRITVENRADSIAISVTDSGNGIPPAIQQKLFQNFFTTKKQGKGTGLGLGISRKIAESHGGSLTLDSQCENTRFIIKVAKKAPEPAKAAA